MTIQDALDFLTSKLASSSDAPFLDAQWILLHLLKQDDASHLIRNKDELLSPSAVSKLKQLCARRTSGEPLAYILGSWEFYGRTFAVTPDTLIPRPDTEQLIDTALDVIRRIYNTTQRPLRVADIGTGSGCIAITLLHESAHISHMYATDISPRTLNIARQNAQSHTMTSRIQFLEGDMLDPLQNIPIDLIVSNPPYIPSAELSQPPTTETRGLRFEPSLALDGGKDGHIYIDRITQSKTPSVIETQGGRIQIYNSI